MRTATPENLDQIEHARAPCDQLLVLKPNFAAEADYFIHDLLMDEALIEGLFENLYNAELPRTGKS